MTQVIVANIGSECTSWMMRDAIFGMGCQIEQGESGLWQGGLIVKGKEEGEGKGRGTWCSNEN